MDRIASLASLLGAALLAAASSQAVAATPPVEANADVIVLRPLSLLKKADMDFGTLLPSATAGTATIDPVTGAVTTAGGVIAGAGPTSPAVFVGAGSRNVPYQIRLPRDPVTLTRSGGTETMALSGWTLDGPTNRRVGANEAFEFNVGGQLAVGADQADGTYVGTFEVTVHYP